MRHSRFAIDSVAVAWHDTTMKLLTTYGPKRDRVRLDAYDILTGERTDSTGVPMLDSALAAGKVMASSPHMAYIPEH